VNDSVLVAGVDSSTQSCKVLVVDADTGVVVREGRAPHPDGTEAPPEAWWTAFQAASEAAGGLDDVAAVSVGGQQHGMVCLDESGSVVRDALLWNDTRSAHAAEELIADLGGASAWADAVGSVPVASFTVTKLRWLAHHEPEAARRTHAVCLPHDWLTWRLRGSPADATTDRGDASGTGYWSTVTGEYRPDLLEMAFGRALEVPRVAEPGEVVGHTPDGLAVSAGTGDNAGAALAIGPAEGEVVISIGTSGAVFTGHDRPSTDASGLVAGFADARGGYLPLLATLNAARVLGVGAALLGVDPSGFDELARAASPGADGLVLLPYLDGERTPDRPDAQGRYVGLTTANGTRENLARATVEGMLCGLADCVDALIDQGVPARRALLIGGGSRSGAVADLAPEVLGLPVEVLAPQEYVALGAARQAAWALHGEEPGWTVARETSRDVTDASISEQVRTRYADVRDGRAP